VSVCISSACLQGVEGVPVRVEVDILSQLPCIQIVGLPQSSVREATERVRSALQAAGLALPRRRVTVNLAPADLPKGGSGLDLPIALAIAQAGSGGDPWPGKPMALGELGLDGSVRPVRGALPLVEGAVRAGADVIVVARGNAPEAALVPGARVLAVDWLAQAWAALRGEQDHLWRGMALPDAPAPGLADVDTLQDLLGPKRAIAIAAAGGHGILLEGPPGSGKSHLARCLAGLLPDLPDEDALVVSRIHSAAGTLPPGRGLLRRPPFRAPHHTASAVAMVGGGNPVLPGEVTLAHRGLLLLDEAPEFPRSVLEGLRQPLQDGIVTVVRAGGAAAVLPSAFQVVLTRNPCPCGLLGSGVGRCRCGDTERDRYLRRLSGPLLDRVEIHQWVDPVETRRLLRAPSAPTAPSLRLRIAEARHALRDLLRELRGADGERPGLQALLRAFDERALLRLEHGLDQARGSARSVQHIVRLALTVAAFEAAGRVAPEHVEEALLLTGGEERTRRLGDGAPLPF
jgi:magnesium chelatase family protein